MLPRLLSPNAWVTDSDHDRIQVFDPTGQFLFRFGERGTGPGQFRDPRCVHVDAATQRVYVTDYENGRVQKFDLTGRFVAAWCGPLGLDRPSPGRLVIEHKGDGCACGLDRAAWRDTASDRPPRAARR